MLNKLYFLLLFLSFYSFSKAQIANSDQIDNFKNITGAELSYNRATGQPNFIKMPRNRSTTLPGSTLHEKSMNFLKVSGEIFNISNAHEKMSVVKQTTDFIGFRHLTYQQIHEGVPIFDGKLIFHYDKNQNLSTINGFTLGNIKVSSTPSISKEGAEEIAMKAVMAEPQHHNHSHGQNTHNTHHNHQRSSAPLKVVASQMYFFHSGMIKGIHGTIHLIHHIEIRNDVDVREFVFVDAHSGKILEHYSGMSHALSRKLFESNTGNLVWEEGDALPGSLDQWQQNEIIAAGHTYHLFNNMFGFTSYDGADAEMQTINNNPTINCPNATWNGVSANYCTGTAADDVVAHEWGHAYTEYNSNLIYLWQSGALNESYSDVWGEVVDLFNNYEDAGEDNSVRTTNSCSESNRWKMGEDATAFGGAIRDMWDPTCNGDPGKVTDSQYFCSDADSGGVHANSGVPNHAFALLVDGGTYNGQTISPLGFVKAIHIWWRVQNVYLTASSDFATFADALDAACQDLLGIDLEGISTTATPAGLSGEIITAADCAEVSEAILAVELRTDPLACNFMPLLEPAPALCANATPTSSFYYEDFESGLNAWTVTQLPENSATWTNRDWVIESSLPDGRAGNAIFGTDPIIGNCTDDLENGIIRLESPIIGIPGSAVSPILMAFDHYIATEKDWDGGNIKYSLDGGTWTILPSSAFVINPYNVTLNTAGAGNDNPMAGEVAFSGSDEGSVAGSWGESHIDLSVIGVVAGSDIQFRWEMGTDGCNGIAGWYVDDIVIFDCASPAVSFSNDMISVNENQATIDNLCLDYFEYAFEVAILQAPSQPATVTISATGSATEMNNQDFSFTPAVVTLDGMNLSEVITVRVYDDGLIEGVESVNFTYALNANGGDAIPDIVNQSHTLTILDDDLAPNQNAISLLNEDFESGLNGFTTTSSGPDVFAIGVTADVSSTYWDIQNTNTTNFPFINDDACNCNLSDVKLISPAFDLSLATMATITFDHAFSDVQGETLDVIVSTDGGTTWSPSVFSITNTSILVSTSTYETPWVNGITVDLSAYAGNNNVMFAFQYDDDGGWLYGAAIDNVSLIADTGIINVQTSVNNTMPDEQYLGPNETVYFYDPVSGDIMLSIENLSSHDYGCTSVSVDRQGTSTQNGWDNNPANFLADKTFKVTPTTNTRNGDYIISVYYTAAEVAGWVSGTGRNQSELFVIYSSGDLSNPMAQDFRESEINSELPFNTDFIYEASFTNRLNQYGIGPELSECETDLLLTAMHSSGIHLFEASNTIKSEEMILGSSTVDYSAGTEIELLRGFSVDLGAVFHAYILGCQ